MAEVHGTLCDQGRVLPKERRSVPNQCRNLFPSQEVMSLWYSLLGQYGSSCYHRYSTSMRTTCRVDQIYI